MSSLVPFPLATTKGMLAEATSRRAFISDDAPIFLSSLLGAAVNDVCLQQCKTNETTPFIKPQ